MKEVGVASPALLATWVTALDACRGDREQWANDIDEALRRDSNKPISDGPSASSKGEHLIYGVKSAQRLSDSPIALTFSISFESGTCTHISVPRPGRECSLN